MQFIPIYFILKILTADEVAPVTLDIYPADQYVHEEAPVPLYVPAGHWEQEFEKEYE